MGERDSIARGKKKGRYHLGQFKKRRRRTFVRSFHLGNISLFAMINISKKEEKN